MNGTGHFSNLKISIVTYAELNCALTLSGAPRGNSAIGIVFSLNSILHSPASRKVSGFIFFIVN